MKNRIFLPLVESWITAYTETKPVRVAGAAGVSPSHKTPTKDLLCRLSASASRAPLFLFFFLYLLLLQNCRGKGHQEQRGPGYHRVFSPFPNSPSLLLMEERCNIYNITLLSSLSTCTSRNQLAPRKGSCRSQGAHAKVLLPIYIHQPNPESRRKVLKSRARQANPEYFADQERPVCAVLHTPGPCYTTLFFRQIRRFFYFV